ncbi:hypothetical protein IFR05_016780 [Cadophora sp. M221]|nr:hypothetical protein IFR05_016780 [Cadophora sp. M221]
MDRREHPQLPPRSGAVPQLPPRPRPVPPLPLRQAVSSPHEPESTKNHGYRQFNVEHYTQATVSDELQLDALEDVTAQLERLKTAPEIDVNGTKSAVKNHARGTKTDIETSYGIKHLSHLDNSLIPISELVLSLLERGPHDRHKNLTYTLGYLPMAINLQEAIFTENIQL